MYRQVLVHSDDAEFQKILFRENTDQSVKELKLDTVTYGTACAPFLAIRTLHQLANDEIIHHPKASAIVKKDFYVDDLLTGASTLNEAAYLRDELIALLKKGGFHLTKWRSNDPSLIIENSNNLINKNVSLDSSSTVKTLGIHWNPCEDVIFYKVDISKFSKIVSKRSILSQVAKLFDPSGLLGPVIVKAKIMIQLLWKAGVSWDSSIPTEVHTMWLQFKNQLPLLENIHFPRFILAPDSIHFELHGFCDASEQAYGACVYVRATDVKGKHHMSLVCSKSRVAPVNIVSLPRLELSAALLLARLFVSVKQALPIEFNNVYMWSDSMITLHWIKTEPHLLKTFVANRVAEIQNLSKNCEWRHVPTLENPADLVSRGLSPREFLESKIWKKGPLWLEQEEKMWPSGKIATIDIPERKIITASLQIETYFVDDNFAKRFSSVKKLNLVLAYVFRFIHNVKNPLEKRVGPITLEEIYKANQSLILNIQSSAFSKEIRLLKNNEIIQDKSKLIPLPPFLDKSGILRVGGRLENSKIPENAKHQVLLPANHHVTRLIICEEHKRLKHAGAQATLYSIRESFWPLDGRNITRRIVRQCIQCFRAKPRDVECIMGNLPQERLSINRPFLNVGVDYCGPLYVKEKRYRNKNRIKVYVAIFVCMSAKAVHLELVSDLTSKAFLACLKKLFSRRGISHNISSDNAKNFVGASRELINLYEAIQPLTPGHFLIVGPLTSFPQLDLTDTNRNRLSAWENAQRLRQHFWKRWQKEYINQLTVRPKWQINSKHAINIGSLVLMKEENLPPLQWKLGRVIAIHPGPDGIIRLVTLKTDTGEYKRCVKKLCPLPIEEPSETTIVSEN